MKSKVTQGHEAVEEGFVVDGFLGQQRSLAVCWHCIGSALGWEVVGPSTVNDWSELAYERGTALMCFHEMAP